MIGKDLSFLLLHSHDRPRTHITSVSRLVELKLFENGSPEFELTCQALFESPLPVVVTNFSDLEACLADNENGFYDVIKAISHVDYKTWKELLDPVLDRYRMPLVLRNQMSLT